jgi:GAF domain
MDRYSILDQNARGTGIIAVAERDLDAALQLLADRARYLTGASGVSIGLRSGAAVICRASKGLSASEVGAPVQSDSGLIGESLHRRQIVYCDDAAKGSRSSREQWRQLGIRSVMVGPLVRDEEVVGVFQLLAERDHAFEDRDVATLQRLSDLMVTALEQFDAGKQPSKESFNPKLVEASPRETESELRAAGMAVNTLAVPSAPEPQTAPVLQLEKPEAEPYRVQSCQACGFPVSEFRTLCVDCEEAQLAEQTPAFSWQLSAPRKPGWLQSHLYTMGTILIAALTVVLLVLKLR